MKHKHHSMNSIVFGWLLEGRRITQEFCLQKTGYWRLSRVIYDLEKRYGIKIQRRSVAAKKAQYQTAYYLDEATRFDLHERFDSEVVLSKARRHQVINNFNSTQSSLPTTRLNSGCIRATVHNI